MSYRKEIAASADVSAWEGSTTGGASCGYPGCWAWFAHVLAWTAPQGDLSPSAPTDLKRPIFDTAKRGIDTSHEQEKSAASVVAAVGDRAITPGDVWDRVAEAIARAMKRVTGRKLDISGQEKTGKELKRGEIEKDGPTFSRNS